MVLPPNNHVYPFGMWSIFITPVTQPWLFLVVPGTDANLWKRYGRPEVLQSCSIQYRHAVHLKHIPYCTRVFLLPRKNIQFRAITQECCGNCNPTRPIFGELLLLTALEKSVETKIYAIDLQVRLQWQPPTGKDKFRLCHRFLHSREPTPMCWARSFAKLR